MGCASVCNGKVISNATKDLRLYSSYNESDEDSEFQTITSEEDNSSHDKIDSIKLPDSSFILTNKSLKEPSISICEISRQQQSQRKKTSVSRVLNSKGTLNTKKTHRTTIFNKSIRSLAAKKHTKDIKSMRKVSRY